MTMPKKQLAVGDKVRVKERPYHWHGNRAVGAITEILSGGAPNIEVTFGAGPGCQAAHFDLFNVGDLVRIAVDAPLTPCPPESGCR